MLETGLCRNNVSLQMQLMEMYALGLDTKIQYILSEWTSDYFVLPPLPYKYSKRRHGNLQGYQLRATTVLVSHTYRL